MLRKMRKTLGACIAAGAIGLVSGQAAPPTVPVSDGQAKLEAMKVELAWMADAKAFNLSLQAVPTSDGLELRGRVADDQTRQHVMKLARQACYLPVKDALELGQASADPALQEAASSAVAGAVGGRGSKVAVAVEQGGVIKLTGSVASVEEKVNAGRALRGLPGCSRVDNRVTIVPVHRDGAVITPVSRDGRQAVLGPVTTPGAVIAVKADHAPAVVQEVAQAPKPCAPNGLRIYSGESTGIVLPPAPTPVLPSGPPAMRYVRIQVRHEPLEPAPRPTVKPHVSGYATGTKVSTEALPGYPGCTSCGDGVALTAARVDPPPTLIGHLRGILNPAKRDHVLPKPLPRPTTVLSPVRVITQEPPPVPAAPAAPAAPATNQVGHVTMTVPAAAPSAWPPAHATTVITPYRNVQPPAPVVVNEPAPPRAATPAPTVTPVAAVEESSDTPLSPPTEQMRKAIADGCGKLVKQVKVETRPDGQPVYHLHASAKFEQELVAKLLSIPQVVSSSAHIQIHLQP